MLAKQTIRYTLPMTTIEERNEALTFGSRLASFYEWGGAKVRIEERENVLIVEYDHLIETKETAFGDG